VFKQRQAKVRLIVYSEHDANAQISDNIRPIQIVPKALFQPVKANLRRSQTGHAKSREYNGLFSFQDELNVVTSC